MDLLKNQPQNLDHYQNSNHNLEPSINAYDNGSCFIVEILAPGMNPEDFDVSVKDGVLSINASHKDQDAIEKQYLKEEFPHQLVKISRYYPLPQAVDKHEFKRFYDRGILKIIFNKQ